MEWSRSAKSGWRCCGAEERRLRGFGEPRPGCDPWRATFERASERPRATTSCARLPGCLRVFRRGAGGSPQAKTKRRLRDGDCWLGPNRREQKIGLLTIRRDCAKGEKLDEGHARQGQQLAQARSKRPVLVRDRKEVQALSWKTRSGGSFPIARTGRNKTCGPPEDVSPF